MMTSSLASSTGFLGATRVEWPTPPFLYATPHVCLLPPLPAWATVTSLAIMTRFHRTDDQKIIVVIMATPTEQVHSYHRMSSPHADLMRGSEQITHTAHPARKWPGQCQPSPDRPPRAHAPVPQHPASPVIQSGQGGWGPRGGSSSSPRPPAGVGLSPALSKLQEREHHPPLHPHPQSQTVCPACYGSPQTLTPPWEAAHCYMLY